jgi:hypothetical protein
VSDACPRACAICPLSLLCLGGQLQLTRCRNCQRLFVYSEELHLIGYPHGDKRWPEGFFTRRGEEEVYIVETPLGHKDACPRCAPLQWTWRWDDGTQRSRRRWRIIDCDLEPGL